VISAPALNAILNSSSAIFLTAGYVQIRRRRITSHRACMFIAFSCSVAFLASYVI